MVEQFVHYPLKRFNYRFVRQKKKLRVFMNVIRRRMTATTQYFHFAFCMNFFVYFIRSSVAECGQGWQLSSPRYSSVALRVWKCDNKSRHKVIDLCNSNSILPLLLFERVFPTHMSTQFEIAETNNNNKKIKEETLLMTTTKQHFVTCIIWCEWLYLAENKCPIWANDNVYISK